ncbi:MAG: hypothetical protein RLZZ58_1923 [Pseudomonadota bacterium]
MIKTQAPRWSHAVRAAVAAAALLALSACAATPFRADVARFQSQLPAPQGQSFTIAANDPALAGGIEFGQYARMVAGELSGYGYREAAPGERADMVVRLGYGVDQGKERVRREPAFYDPFYDPFYSPFYRRGLYRPAYVSGYHGRGFVYGLYDPWMWGGYGAFGRDELRVYTVYGSALDMNIVRADNGERLFEGRAEAQSRSNNLQHLVPNLVEAMFTGFPGNSGEKVRITVAPPPKAK